MGGLLSWCTIARISDQLPPILLRGQANTHLRKLLLGEGDLPAAMLARDLDEAWLDQLEGVAFWRCGKCILC
jgi:hypothetical protein